MATSFLTAQELNRKLNQLFSLERKTTAQIVECLLEIKKRRTYLEFSYTGLFSYLTKHFKHTEATAQRWIECVRMAEKLPEISDDLKSGALNQTQVCLLSQALREKERQGKKQQRHEQEQEKNEKQQLRQGQEEKPGQVELGQEENQQQMKNQEERVVTHSNDLLSQITNNLLPQIRNQTASQTQVLLSQALDLPLKPYEKKSYQKDESIRLEITLTKEQMKQIERVKELLSHKYPYLSLAELISVLAQEVIQQRDPLVKKVKAPVFKAKTCNHSDTSKMEVPSRGSQCMPVSNLKTNSTGSQNMVAFSLEAFSKNSQRSPASKLKVPSKVTSNLLTGSSHSKSHRAIPRWVQRAVYQRDLCCQWKMQDESQDKAQICGSKFQLQLDHIQPRWAGGTDEVHNLQLLCAAHNRQKYQREAGIKRYS